MEESEGVDESHALLNIVPIPQKRGKILPRVMRLASHGNYHPLYCVHPMIVDVLPYVIWWWQSEQYKFEQTYQKVDPKCAHLHE